MKKFNWRLQRLLDVRRKQEDALRSELMGLTEQAAALRGRILMEKAMLRSRLSELRTAAAGERLGRQRAFMEDVAVTDRRMAELNKALNELEQKRKDKTEAIMAARKFRKALERLRDQARQDYQRLLHAEEQTLQDDGVNAAYARRIMGLV